MIKRAIYSSLTTFLFFLLQSPASSQILQKQQSLATGPAVSALNLGDLPVQIDRITRKTEVDQGEGSSTGFSYDTFYYDYRWTFIEYGFCNADDVTVLSIKFVRFDFTDDGSFKKKSRLTARQKGGFPPHDCDLSFRAHLPQKGHKYVVAIQKVDTESGTWLVNMEQLTVAAKSVIAGKEPKLPTPVFQPKK